MFEKLIQHAYAITLVATLVCAALAIGGHS